MRTKTLIGMIVGAAALSAVAAATPALAGQPAPSGNIELTSGVAPAGDISAQSSDGVHHYGDTVAFTAEVFGKVSSQSTAYIKVVCRQGDTFVYHRAGALGDSFVMVDQGDPNLFWDGGDASCAGVLYYMVEKGKQIDLTVLDWVEFPVSA